MAVAAGSGSGDVLSDGIDAGRVDGLSAEVTISRGGSVSGGGSRGKVTWQGDGAHWGDNRF